MGKYKKKDILKTVNSLFKANENVCKFVEKNPAGVVEVLIACQESALLLGTALEEMDEKYACLVKILEEYCEKLYQISTHLSDIKLCRTLSKEIHRQLIELNNGIARLPDDKKEMVFLPYKASMWDSLESIWKAAKNDENCDTYVIPIPYFDKNPDGSFGEEHYEGNQYPDYVPVMRYDEYDFEGRRPDVIFIHNPYDEYNRVTSVHPFFYAKNLKQFTEMLVYIPYFIISDNVPSHYCALPGTLYADRTYVHSEAAARVYRKELRKMIEKKELERRIVGIGSPKIDRVLEYEVEEEKIPEKWRELLRFSDKKKIILYNTHLNGLMSFNGRLAIEKIKDTLQWFKRREDMILWWRPHPLSMATVRAMNPAVEEEYTRLVQEYRKEGWGIYDETENLNRAIALSDAYFGDGSSVLLLYKQTGKPILRQNRRVRQEDGK